MTAPAIAEARLDAVFAALADPTRRAIVRRLAEGDATVNELAAPFAMSLPGISKHLKVLEQSGLITRSRYAQFRPCHLEVTTLDSTMEWIAQQRQLWDDRLDKLDAHLQAIQGTARQREERSDHG
jgi:DNA-binding transcriptional ArsR family regulator